MAYSLWSVCDPPEEMIDWRPSTRAPICGEPAGGLGQRQPAPCRFWKAIEARGTKRRVQFLIRFVFGFLRDDGRKGRTGTEG